MPTNEDAKPTLADDETESEEDAKGQRLAENDQQQPRTVTQKIGNAIEDLIPGDSDGDGH